jgi:pyrroloquinoline quinone biosynthesis protein D
VAEAEVTEGRKPRLLAKTRMRYDKVRQSYVLLLPERAVLLNATAAEVLELCDGTRTVAGVIEALQHKYPGADLHGDVVELLQEADKRGWIEWILGE